MSDLLLYIAAGAGVGFAVGLTGIGGGSLMTPLLLLFGFPLHIAVGTDLLYAAITKASGMLAHARQSTVQWRPTLLLAAGSLPASIITIIALHLFFDAPETYEPLLTLALGMMLMVTASSILLAGRIRHISGAHTPLRRYISKHQSLCVLCTGAALGMCVTLSSVGAGAFGAAVLILLYPTLRMVQVVGTDIAHAVPLTLVAGLGHWSLGNVDFLLLGALVAGSAPAIWLGARLANRIPETMLRPALALLLMGLGIRFVIY